GDPSAGELELGVIGEHRDEAVEIVVVEREQVARHQVLDRGAVGRILVVVGLHIHALSFSCRAISAACAGLRNSRAKVCLYSWFSGRRCGTAATIAAARSFTPSRNSEWVRMNSSSARMPSSTRSPTSSLVMNRWCRLLDDCRALSVSA